MIYRSFRWTTTATDLEAARGTNLGAARATDLGAASVTDLGAARAHLTKNNEARKRRLLSNKKQRETSSEVSFECILLLRVLMLMVSIHLKDS
jgi:hypothetical protein